ncbi:MAG: hypothetical protein PF489_05385 [Salinivirgaceae bacterium]|nr:hypothetical protein [Salinivirgaceae bacterium]
MKQGSLFRNSRNSNNRQCCFFHIGFYAIFTILTVPVLLKWTTLWLRNRGELVNVGQRTGFLIVGVNRLSLLVAGHLKERSFVKMIDTNIGWHCLRKAYSGYRANRYQGMGS